MNKSKIFGWMMILGLLVFGIFSVNAQKISGETLKKWEIIVTNFTNLDEGRSFSVNSQGTLVKLETTDGGKTNNPTAEVLKAEDMQKIGELIGKLNLPQTTSESTVGKGENNPPYWSFSIEIGGKGYMMDGEFATNIKVRVLTDEQKAVFAELKGKLNKIGIVLPKQAGIVPVNSLNLPTGFSLPLNPAEQKMIFRVVYWSSGESFQHKGWYMDESGKVYKYSYDLKQNPQNPTSYDFKFKMLPTLVAEAKPDELTKWREVLKRIERGKYTEKHVSFDKGTAEISAFLPDSETGEYREIRLASIGDVEGINDAPEVIELIEWLERVVPLDGLEN